MGLKVMERMSQSSCSIVSDYQRQEEADSIFRSLVENSFGHEQTLIDQIDDWRVAHKVMVHLARSTFSQELFMRVHIRLRDLLDDSVIPTVRTELLYSVATSLQHRVQHS